MWDFRVLKFLRFTVGFILFPLSLEIVKMGFSWVFSGIYGPLSEKERREMWEE